MEPGMIGLLAAMAICGLLTGAFSYRRGDDGAFMTGWGAAAAFALLAGLLLEGVS